MQAVEVRDHIPAAVLGLNLEIVPLEEAMHQPVARLEGRQEALLQVALNREVPFQPVQQPAERAAINFIQHIPSRFPAREDVPTLVQAPEAQQ